MLTEDELEITLADFYHPFPLALKNNRKLEDIKLTIDETHSNTLITSEPVYIQTSKIRIDPERYTKLTITKPILYCATGFLLLNEDSIYTLSTSTGVYRKEYLELSHCFHEDLIPFLKELLAKDEPVLIPLVKYQNNSYDCPLAQFRFAVDQKLHDQDSKKSKIKILIADIPQVCKYGITNKQQILRKKY